MAKKKKSVETDETAIKDVAVETETQIIEDIKTEEVVVEDKPVIENKEKEATMSAPVDVLIVNLNRKNSIPKYANDGDAAVDGCANLTERKVIGPGETALIPLGIKCAIPEGYEIQVRPRSGLALKKSVTILNSPGTIDSGYRNEIGAILINHGRKAFAVAPGDRICQLALNKIEKINFVECDNLDETARGLNGYGSSGV